MSDGTGENFFFSGIWAGIITGIDVLHKKFGGFLSAGSYSDPNSWAEMTEMLPRFAFLFFVIFMGAYIYFDYRSHR